MSDFSSARCDICTYRDGFKGLTMVMCRRCGLFVHKQCYGFETNERKIICWACEAVGKSFQIENFDDNGNRKWMVQKSRPNKCALCCVRDGIHAMHPLFDNHGLSGRQMVIRHPTQPHLHEDELAWVHSLCAFFISESEGLVYGCARDGTFDGIDEEEEDDIDQRPPNPFWLPQTTPGTVHESVHHFVYCLRKPGQIQHNPWTKRIEELQQEVKCVDCGIVDKHKFVFRIPFQCFANTDSEIEDFKASHKRMAPDENCTQAMHVGCARWKEPTGINRVFFFPGSKTHYSEAVANMFCRLHADQVKKYLSAEKRKNATETNNNNNQTTPVKPKATTKTTTNNNNVITKTKKPPSSVSRRLSSPHQNRAKITPPSHKNSSSNNSTPTFPDLRKAKKTTLPMDQVSLHGSAGGQGKRPRMSKEAIMAGNIDKDEAISVSRMPRPLLKSSRTNTTTETRKFDEVDREFQEMKNDLLLAIKKQDINEQKQAVIGCKAKWKRSMGLLSREEFESVWKHTRDEVRKEMLNPSPPPGAPDQAPSGIAPSSLSNNDNNGNRQQSGPSMPETSMRRNNNNDKNNQAIMNHDSFDTTDNKLDNDDNNKNNNDNNNASDGHSDTGDSTIDKVDDTINSYGGNDDNDNNNNNTNINNVCIQNNTSGVVDIDAAVAATAQKMDIVKKNPQPRPTSFSEWSHLTVGPLGITQYKFGDWDVRQIVGMEVPCQSSQKDNDVVDPSFEI